MQLPFYDSDTPQIPSSLESHLLNYHIYDLIHVHSLFSVIHEMLQHKTDD